jgi:3-carboxy-cis,cis-muconate cycloisomerase
MDGGDAPGPDSGLLAPVWAGTPVAAVTDDRAWLAAMVRAEAALATAQAALGAVPQGTAAAVRAAAADLDVVSIARRSRESANPVVAFVADLTAAVARRDPAAADHVHAGCTSQDILDTAAVLVTADALALMRADLLRVAAALAGHVERHRDTLAVARTLTQHALPTTFGLKAATWLDLVHAAADRIAAASAGLPVQLGGAVGTLAGYREHLAATDGPERGVCPELRLVELVAGELGLRAPALPWHTGRTPLADVAAALTFASGALGKVAADVLVLSRTEIAEVAEPAAEGRGASSAMPQKRNPVLSTLIAAAARQVPVFALVISQAVVAEDERPAGAWHAEWSALRECLRLTGGAAHTAAELVRGLVVDAERMAANAAATGDALTTERVVAHLVAHLGRSRAKRLVTAALVESPQDVRGALARALRQEGVDLDVDRLFTPEDYLGAARALVDGALSAARRHRPES